MAVRVLDIAHKHGDKWADFARKAAQVGFAFKHPTWTIDKITAEALELAVYGNALICNLSGLLKTTSDLRSRSSLPQGAHRNLDLKSDIKGRRSGVKGSLSKRRQNGDLN
jgi:hypothetical protein